MTDWLSDPQAWLALATLTTLEIVLGVDNIVMLVVLTARLPASEQPLARRVGLLVALALRVLLLLSLSWLLGLTAPLFELWDIAFSGRDLILVGGGLFLVAKGTHEIHATAEGVEAPQRQTARHATLSWVLVQIAVLDLVFSLDSVITAIGMARRVQIMVLAIMTATLVMVVLAEPLARFVNRHPTVKMLALSFLLLIGVVLIADGFHHHVPRGYIYFALVFSVFVEAVNLRAGRHGRRAPTAA